MGVDRCRSVTDGNNSWWKTLFINSFWFSFIENIYNKTNDRYFKSVIRLYTFELVIFDKHGSLTNPKYFQQQTVTKSKVYFIPF